MSRPATFPDRLAAVTGIKVPELVPDVFRGIGQVFFQENASAGAFFAIGIAFGSPLMAVAAIVGSAIGTATARLLKYDVGEIRAGIFGFNATLVAMASTFFFQPGLFSLALGLVGTIAVVPVTWAVRRFVPFPTYTAPFIVVTWIVFFTGNALALAAAHSDGPPIAAGFIAAVSHGIGQVMFQANVWTGLFFLVGIAINDREHAAWVVLASILGWAVGTYHHASPEESAGLGLYGYNATLAAIALFLWRRSLIAPLLGILVSVPLTEYFPLTGLPTLTVPFLLATWLVLSIGWLEGRLFGRLDFPGS
jgi:urea transporter